MAEIGVLDECLTAGYQGDGSQVAGPDGTVLAQATAPPPGDLPAAGNGIQRRELCRILLNAAVKAGARSSTLVQNYSAALMRQEQGEPTGADLRLLELPVPTVQARLALPY